MSKNLSKANASGRGFPLEYTRNIGIAAHIDAGKTTTTERILFYAGVVHQMGDVHDGNTVTDHMEQERERGITITSAAISCGWTTGKGPFASIDHRVNIIDTPGHVDFTAEVERSLRVLDGAVAVFSGVDGVQPQSEKVWYQMDKYNVPRMAFINKMDRMGADFYAAVNDISQKLGGNAHPIYLPIGAEESFVGLIDLIEERAYVYDATDKQGMRFNVEEVPESEKERVSEYREKLLEALCYFDDALAETYLEGGVISQEEMRKAIRKATLSRDFVPVIPGSALKNKGVQMVLDAVVDYLPGPLDVVPMKAFDEDEAETAVVADDNAPLSGLVFKLWSDPYVGKLVFFRVYSGVLEKGASLYNPRTRKMERVSRLMVMKADSKEDIQKAYSGDICALIGVKGVATGDTLCDKSKILSLEPPTFPEPVISVSIEPETKADQERMSVGLQRLSDEDPTFCISTNHETGQTIISGMGELHLEILRDRLFREFKVQATSGRPQIAYRETITVASEAEGKFIRQSGGRGQYGHAVIKLEPNESGKGIEVVNQIVGGVIPKEYIKPTIEGIYEAANDGTVAGYPVVDFKVCLVDGSFHEVDSSELAFKMAGIFAFKEAMKKAKPILLEPVMSVEVRSPNEYQGDIVGDLNRRRGKMQNMENKSQSTIIDCFVPLEAMFGYATDVRSLSQGRADYSMNFSHFEPVPSSQLEQIVKNSPRKAART